MKTKNLLILFPVLAACILFPYSSGWTVPKPGAYAPVITHSFAVEKGQYGYIWKVYLEAEDPDGDMLRIASVVQQVGYGYYPADWTYIKPKFGKHFKGYLQWNTFSSKTSHLSEWTQITLKVSIFDRMGNESNVIIFPFTFETGVKNPYKYTLPAPFDQGELPRIGHIHVDLYDHTIVDGRTRED